LIADERQAPFRGDADNAAVDIASRVNRSPVKAPRPSDIHSAGIVDVSDANARWPGLRSASVGAGIDQTPVTAAPPDPAPINDSNSKQT